MFNLSQCIDNYLKEDFVHLHTPAHCGTLNPRDLSEVGDLDDLNNPQGVLSIAQTQTAKLFGAAHSFFLVNGASVGLMAACLALKIYLGSNTKPILVSRNIHKSVVSGIILADLNIDWLEPNWDEELGVFTHLKLNISEIEKKYSALIITNPTYEGFFSLIPKLSIPIIVDEAHGAHYIFSNQLPESALEMGADIIIQSWHKTLGSLTQTGVLHVNHKSKIPAELCQMTVSMLQTTSSSYLLLESLCQTLEKYQNQGQKIIETTIKKALEINHCLRLNQDPSRLLINIPGYSGRELDDYLYIKKISCERILINHALALFNPGNTKPDQERLNRALEEIPPKQTKKITVEKPKSLQQITQPRIAFLSKKKKISSEDAINKTSAELFAVCPPGICILVPGALITKDSIEFLLQASKTEVLVIDE